MLFKKDSLTIRPRKQPRLPDDLSSLARTSSKLSARTSRYNRICSLPTLPTTSCSSKDDSDNVDRLDALSEIALDSDLDRRSSSSTTLFSPRLSESPSTTQLSTDDHNVSLESETRHSFRYPLREPGQLTAQRIQRLRARTAAVIMTIPATSEDVEEEDEPREAVPSSSATQTSKFLRRVSGVRDLRRAFRDGDPGPVQLVSPFSFEQSKASYEFGILSDPTPSLSLSHLSPRSSLRTLVDSGNALPRSSSDLKTLCGSTLSSLSMKSRFSTKVQSGFLLSLSSHYACLSADASHLKSPRKYSVYNPSTPRPRRHVSLQIQESCASGSPEDTLWSCAKISQSAIKRAARRGPGQRRVFSNPIAGLLPRGHLSPSDPD